MMLRDQTATGDHTPSPLTSKTTTSRGGAPKGNRNALKHGRYTRTMFALRTEARANLAKINATLALLAARQAEITPPRRASPAAPEAPGRP